MGACPCPALSRSGDHGPMVVSSTQEKPRRFSDELELGWSASARRRSVRSSPPSKTRASPSSSFSSWAFRPFPFPQGRNARHGDHRSPAGAPADRRAAGHLAPQPLATARACRVQAAALHHFAHEADPARRASVSPAPRLSFPLPREPGGVRPPRSRGTAGAFFAPPFSGLDTLPALGVVLLSLGFLLEDILVALPGAIVGATGVVLELTLGSLAFHALGNLF